MGDGPTRRGLGVPWRHVRLDDRPMHCDHALSRAGVRLVIRWGLIGVGRAGRARAAAIQACSRSTLVAAVGGDPSRIGLESSPSLEVLLSKVDAVAICSPDDTHADLVETALRHGLHVVCEFPLAPSRARAQALFDLADAQGCTLHVEHIELLASTQHVFADRLVGAQVTGGHVRFTGPPRRGAASVPHANVARLHRVVDALGLPESVSSRGLHFGDAVLEVDFRLAEGLPRHTSIRVETADQTVELRDHQVLIDEVAIDLDEGPGLFAQDHACAVSRIRDRGASYVPRARVLDVLGLADALSAF